MSIKSLIINPGSTSTKIGVFEDDTLLFDETLRHSTEEIASYATIVDQKDFPTLSKGFSDTFTFSPVPFAICSPRWLTCEAPPVR